MKCSWSGKINQYAINHRLDWLAPNPPLYFAMFVYRSLTMENKDLFTTLLFIWLSVILCLFLYKHINPWQFKSVPCNSLKLQYFLTVLKVKSTQVAYRRLGQYLLTNVGETMLMQSADWNQPPSPIVVSLTTIEEGGLVVIRLMLMRCLRALWSFVVCNTAYCNGPVNIRPTHNYTVFKTFESNCLSVVLRWIVYVKHSLLPE